MPIYLPNELSVFEPEAIAETFDAALQGTWLHSTR